MSVWIIVNYFAFQFWSSHMSSWIIAMSHMSMWIIVVISHISMWIISDVNVNIADSHVKSRRFTCQCELSWIISHFNVNHFTCQCESSLFLTCQCELFLLYLTCQYKSFYMSTWIIVIWHVNQLIQMSNHDDSHVNVNDCELFRMSMLIISNVMWIIAISHMSMWMIVVIIHISM